MLDPKRRAEFDFPICVYGRTLRFFSTTRAELARINLPRSAFSEREREREREREGITPETRNEQREEEEEYFSADVFR